MRSRSVDLVPLVLAAFLVLLPGCSTLKSWFTPQGQKLSQAKQLAEQGHPLGASALALEALALEPGYAEALAVFRQTFGPGQDEFRDGTARGRASSSADRWDGLVELYRWQDTLHRLGPSVKAVVPVNVESVDEALAEAQTQAAQFHWGRAQQVLASGDGPRLARRALAEGRQAKGYDANLSGLAAWLDTTAAAATQRVMILPFFFEGVWVAGPVSGPLASQLSRQLAEDPGLPELTTVFSSDRLVTLPGGGPARLGLISLPDALKLAASAGQNVVLQGQILSFEYLLPVKSVDQAVREKTVILVDPDHPAGVEKTYRAVVTLTTWQTRLKVSASFELVEVATRADLVSAVREARAESQLVVTTFSGDREALTSVDLRGLADRSKLDEPVVLRDRALARLASSIADVIRGALQ